MAIDTAMNEGGGHPGVTVLLVDDNESVREVLALYAGVHARVCGEAGNGLDGVALAARLQPDAIVLDEEMPVMTGLEALPLLREHAPGTAVVMYASGPPGTEERARAAGAAAYYDKAVPPRTVVAGVLAAIGARAAAAA
jgi:CheY-like chemotaxis protein